MFDLRITTAGLLRFAVAPTRDAVLRDLAGAALAQALAEYASGRLRGASVKDRFTVAAWGRYGFTPRTAAYRKRQHRLTGAIQPYVSPRRKDLARLALSLAKASQGVTGGTALSVVRELSKTMLPRMRDLVRRPGIGHRIIRGGGARRIVLRLAWPGARVLNRGNADLCSVYRTEFADLRRGGGRDWTAITQRAQGIYLSALQATTRRAA
jgi:hypothetical protein